jgi:hypothetical protein
MSIFGTSTFQGKYEYNIKQLNSRIESFLSRKYAIEREIFELTNKITEKNNPSLIGRFAQQTPFVNSADKLRARLSEKEKKLAELNNIINKIQRNKNNRTSQHRDNSNRRKAGVIANKRSRGVLPNSSVASYGVASNGVASNGVASYGGVNKRRTHKCKTNKRRHTKRNRN